MTDEKKLAVIDGETLADMNLPPTKFCVQTLLPQGVTILGGAPKVGKSWMVLDLCVRVAKGESVWGLPTTQGTTLYLCVRVAKGESVWGLPTTQGTTLYLCLEDTLRRVQERLLCVTEDIPASSFFATAAGTLADGLCEQIRSFVAEHPDTALVAIDTFQMVRGGEMDTSYANDYADIQTLKKLADELGIALLLVHHLRKQGDTDPLNKLSGTTGISGAVDAVFVLDKSRRSHDCATLVCTGRDIEYRELELRFDGTDCTWELLEDSMEQPSILLPEELRSFIAFMESIGSFRGSNSELAEQFTVHSGKSISPKSLKQLMNKWRHRLEESGVVFESSRSNGQRLVEVIYGAPAEAQRSGFGGERPSDGADELSSLRGSEAAQSVRTK